jgi:hypothetical protein
MTKPHDPSPPSKQGTRGASRYKRSETTRLLRAATDAGLTVSGIEVDPVTGALRVLVGKRGEPSCNSWDEVLNAEDAKRPA